MRSSRASTATSSRPARTSAWTWRRSSTGSSASSSPTAAGTARSRTARRCRRSARRSTSSRACSSTSARSAARPRWRRHGARGEEYMLERRLFRRKSTGEVIDPSWLRVLVPDLVSLRRPARARLPAGRRDGAGRARRRGGRGRRGQPGTQTVGGRCGTSTRASRTSRWRQGRGSPADGTRSAPCAYSIGPRRR